MEIKNLVHPQLRITSFTARKGDIWCFYGSNRSGINQFLQLLSGQLDHYEGKTLVLPQSPEIISFSVQQEIFEEEIRNDDTDFLNYIDPGTPAKSFLPEDSLSNDLIDSFGMLGCLENGYRQLSSGQSRKLLILRSLLQKNFTIILDSPYDGLDQQTCTELNQAFAHISTHNLHLFIFVRNREDIPVWCTHLAYFSRGAMEMQGKLSEILPRLPDSPANGISLFQRKSDVTEKPAAEPLPGDELIRLNNGFAGYGAKSVFSGLDLKICRGDHTLITGPNGCGKSTLLQIITGDNPKCYANDLYLFGNKRGSGESIWEIKKHMGIVSPDIHRNYRVSGSCLGVVLSGFFDSIGLYDKVSAQQEKIAESWLQAIHLVHHSQTPFKQLSYGEQRLVLIVRALIKNPPLLILDEPTQGLDSPGRKSLLDFLGKTAEGGTTTIIYVSHREDEFMPFFRQHIRLEQYRCSS